MRLVLEVLVAAALAVGVTACDPAATDQELKTACARLVELRKEQPDATVLKQCVADARREGTTSRQARCRAAAVNPQEYWVRCRTGEARQR